MSNEKNQSTDHVNGQGVAGTKELSSGGRVSIANRIEDGGASGKGYKAPPKKEGTR